MKYIWKLIEKRSWDKERKIQFFLFCTTVISSFIGFALWFALHFFILNKISWAICFAGYPGFFIGLLGGVLFLYRHI